MSRKRICCLINAALSEMLLEGVRVFQEEFGNLFSFQAYYSHEIEEERVPAAKIHEDLSSADLVMLDLRGSGRATALAASSLEGKINTVVCLVGGSPEIMGLLRMGPFSLKEIMAKRAKAASAQGGHPQTASSKKPAQEPAMERSGRERVNNILTYINQAGDHLPPPIFRHVENWSKTLRYWAHGGAENIKNLLAFLGLEYLDLPLPAPNDPVEYPEYGLYDPVGKTFYQTLSEYRKETGFDATKPTLGLLFHGGMHFAQSIAAAKALAEKFSPDYNLIPLYSLSDHNLRAIREFFFEGEKPLIDALFYLQWFQLATFSRDDGTGSTVELLKKLNIPVFAGTPLYGREMEKWLEEPQGLSPVEVMTTVIMPELDGMIEPVPSLALKERLHPATGQTVKAATPLDDQIDRIVRRIKRRVALKYKANKNKRVAIIIYDNPPGEDNIGNAAYLDVFTSIREIMNAMAERGYQVKELPPNKEICQQFIDTGAVNNARWVPEDKSLAGAVTMKAERYRQIWESLPLPQEVVETWGDPPGDIMAGQGKIILPGIEFGNVFLGLQPSRGYHSDPDKITHDKTLPPHHQYIAFYKWLEEDWQADAIIHVGTHGTLEFLKGKEVGMSPFCYPALLIGSIPHLYIYHVVNPSEAMIAKRRSLGTIVNYNSPPLTTSGLYQEYADLEEVIGEYHEAVVSDPLRAERVEAKVFEKAKALNLEKGSVSEIQEELALMKRSLIPKGLHILDEVLSIEETAETITYFLRYDRGSVPSLHRLLAEAKGFDYDRLLDAPQEMVNNRPAAKILEDLEEEAKRLVEETIAKGEPSFDNDLAGPLEWALLIHKRICAGLEIKNLLDGLEGAYTEPAIGGEPLRDPDTLPTGRNTFQFDPRQVPSETAYERGCQIAENTLHHYYKLNGHYPKSVGLILWAFETAKTRGETVSQILAYLGVRPVRKTPFKTDLVIIPPEKLGRPRIDITIQICGFFRDMFISVVNLLNQAVAMVSALDESSEENYVKPHTEEMMKKLFEEMDPDKAKKIASARVFGPRAGEYGTRVHNLIETAAWKTEDDLVDTFMANMNHIYADNVHGVRFAEVYKERLSTVDVVSQVRDSHDYEIADLDHYYEYFGGLSRTVESIRGRVPVQLISDTTKERIRTETVGEALERGIRTRLLNPRWIEAMLEHDVHGAQKISDRVEYLIGFSSTTHAVKNWVFSAVAERYMFDEEMRKKLKDNNIYAAEEIMRRLFEAQSRGYWEATEEEMKKLKEIYLEMEGDIEEKL